MPKPLKIAVVPLAVVVAFAVAALVHSHAHPSADPGGRILSVLKTARVIAPAGSEVMLVQAYEPKWDSCDGMAGTFGYGAAYFDMTFMSHKSPAGVVHAAMTAMRARGWDLTSSSVDDPHGAHAHCAFVFTREDSRTPSLHFRDARLRPIGRSSRRLRPRSEPRRTAAERTRKLEGATSARERAHP